MGFDISINVYCRAKVNHQMYMANSKIKELMTKRAEVYERLHQWLRYVNMYHASCDTILHGHP